MKKNISINISGIIFHIEEDGYERLKNYLTSINKYFSTLDDSGEIVADIESRIAEIFLSKLKDGKQVINVEDIDELIATMGSVEDFEAIEAGKELFEKEEEKEEKEEPKKQKSTQSKSTETSGKLYRDGKKSLIGGVCAGIAHYLKVDPFWVRLVFIGLLFDVFFSSTIGWLTFVTYIILWIVIPPKYDLPEDKKVKKMFRDPDKRVFGGVASGVAAYFGVDPNLIRVLFVLTAIFGGSGIIIYLILWIITPEAKGLTDKMKMQGEPVTLSNIESNIKKSLKVEKDKEESVFVKILLFPFRLIAVIFEALGKALGPILKFLGEAVRVGFGLLLIFIALVTLVSIIAVSGVFLGIIAGKGTIFLDQLGVHNFMLDGIPIDVLSGTVPLFATIFGFLAIGIPFLGLVLLGIAIITKRRSLNAPIGWSLFALWIISMMAFAFTVPSIIGNFKETGSFRKTQQYHLDYKTILLQLNEVGMDDYEGVKLKLLGHNEPDYKLVQKFSARGKSRREAIENARMVSYTVQQNDSILNFDSNILFNEQSKFRAQKVNMTLYIPYNRPFMMDENLKYIIRNTINRNGYRVSQMEGNTWMFTPSGLKCISCGSRSSNRAYNEPKNNKWEEDPIAYSTKKHQKNYTIEDFTDLKIGGLFEINVQQGDNYNITISSDEDKILNKVEVRKDGNQLRIDLKDNAFSKYHNKERPRINITMPRLEAIDFSGASKAFIEGYKGDDFLVNLSGAAICYLSTSTSEIDIDLSGASQLTLEGKSDYMIADVSGASRLKAFEFTTTSADIEARGASHLRLRVEEDLNVDASGASSVRYRGNPTIYIEKGSMSSVKKD
ncbi:PspC domain-containing protein [Xanthovirga aplysinae]|uniref:PspC domain-containing protein n=1 Tax=Xanthovirga aplysinae TaxID=2529853 RepID=UPI0012BBE862|nr:PspC domain-containing protein [Xanthovirga aplysinae]MTI32390.1 PspC domain-containing protein [Xanthovirga aplysinae]